MLGGLDYQTIAQYVYRLATALGYARSGANTDITSLSAVDIINGGAPSQTLVDGASVDWNANLGSYAQWTIGGNRTLNSPTNVRPGGIYVLQVIQDATGGRTITWGANFRGVNRSSQPPQPQGAAGIQTFFVFLAASTSILTLVAQSTPALGQCRLTKSGGNLLLSPFGGNSITIRGRVEPIPDAGVTLSTATLAASTLYYIYAFISGSTLTLEAVVTAPAAQAGSGVLIKTGDPTRTLVGMARTDGATAWADSATQRFVRSWFNDPGFAAKNTFTADRSTASATYVELNTEIRVEFLAWSGEVFEMSVNGSGDNTLADYSGVAVGVDGTTAEAGFETICMIYANTATGSIAISGNKSDFSEGYHYATVLAKHNAAGTLSLHSTTGAAKAKVYLHVGTNGR